MVDPAGRRRVSFDSVDFVSAGHVRTSRMAVVVVVWPGHNLVVRPNCVVLGHSYYEVLHLALSIGDSLVDAMGKAVKKIEQTVDGGHELRAAEFQNRPRNYNFFSFHHFSMIL